MANRLFPELTAELKIMLELLKGWGYRVFEAAPVNDPPWGEYPAINIVLEPEGLYFKVWATEHNHLHLRLLLWRNSHLHEGDEGFDEAFDQLTVGALKAAVKAAEDIHSACLLIFFVKDRNLHWGSLFFREDYSEYGSIAIHEWLRKYFGEKLAKVIDYPKALQTTQS